MWPSYVSLIFMKKKKQQGTSYAIHSGVYLDFLIRGDRRSVRAEQIKPILQMYHCWPTYYILQCDVRYTTSEGELTLLGGNRVFQGGVLPPMGWLDKPLDICTFRYSKDQSDRRSQYIAHTKPLLLHKVLRPSLQRINIYCSVMQHHTA